MPEHDAACLPARNFFQIPLQVLTDAAKNVSKAYRVDNLPLIVLVDRHGVVRARHDALDVREERGLMVSLRDLIDE